MSGVEPLGITSIDLCKLEVMTKLTAVAAHIMVPSGEAFPEPMIVLTMSTATVHADYDDQTSRVIVMEPAHLAEMLPKLLDALITVKTLKES